MNETIKTIMDWHAETFPDANFCGQAEKFDEELQEFLDSKCEDAKELADCWIVLCGMLRFVDDMGIFLWFRKMDALLQVASDDILLNLQQVINDKMRENRSRVWKKTGNNYHHVEGDDEK